LVRASEKGELVILSINSWKTTKKKDVYGEGGPSKTSVKVWTMRMAKGKQISDVLASPGQDRHHGLGNQTVQTYKVTLRKGGDRKTG